MKLIPPAVVSTRILVFISMIGLLSFNAQGEVDGSRPIPHRVQEDQLPASIGHLPKTIASTPTAAAKGTANAEKTEDSSQIFNRRFNEKPGTTISSLRKNLMLRPDDWRTRYYLASVLIENVRSDADLKEAEGLLEGADNLREPDWLAPWALARRLQMLTISIERLQTKGQALPPKQKLLFLEDGELPTFLRRQLGRLDAATAPFRQATNGTMAVLTGDEVREDLFTLKNLLSSRWAYVEEKRSQTGRSLDEIFQVAFAEVRPKMSHREAGDVLRRAASSLLDGHTVVTVPDGSFLTSLPVRLEEMAEGLIVTETLPTSPFKVGDRFLSVNSQSAHEALRDEELRWFGSTESGRRWRAVLALPTLWNENKSYQVMVERDGQPLLLEASPVPVEALPWANSAELLSSSNWLDPRMIDQHTGYLRVKTWAPLDNNSPFANSGPCIERFTKDLDAAIAMLKDAKDIVIDLRSNGGGSDALCSWLASYFVPEPMCIYVLRYRSMETKSEDGFDNPERKPATYQRQPGPVLPAKLWVLVDSGSFSATDTFLNILKRNIPDRVTLIGRPSNAGIGGPQMVGTLRNTNATVTVSTCKAYSVCGELLEGNPVKIDVPIQPTRADVLAGRDPDLEEALRLISKSR